MKNTENYTADRPISLEIEDKFQRYGFSKRIAETIVNRKSKDSIVFGIFGAWGEGKTSIINFIKKEIEVQGEDFIQISFNPWRFKDEGILLDSFFNKLALEINKAFFPDNIHNVKEPLKTKKEAVGDLHKKYGEMASIFGAGGAVKRLGEVFSDVDIEALKARIEDLIQESKKRIVIYIDDIDRLDKSEIYSIFRLVKLTGDFYYTSYILSFDEEMVAAAIGERFGSVDKKAGESFLEKIIQIPLNIPKAQPNALKNFCFKLVDNALDANAITLTEDQLGTHCFLGVFGGSWTLSVVFNGLEFTVFYLLDS